MSENVIDLKAPNGHVVHLRTQAFINNKFVDAVSGKTLDTVNPSNEQLIAKVAACEKADVDVAVAAARAAFPAFSALSGSERGVLLNKLADIIEKNKEELTTIEVMDNGKPYSQYAAADMPLVIKCLRYYAGWADKITGQT